MCDRAILLIGYVGGLRRSEIVDLDVGAEESDPTIVTIPSVGAARLSHKHVARLINRCVLEAGIRVDLPDEERVKLFSCHSLRGRACLKCRS